MTRNNVLFITVVTAFILLMVGVSLAPTTAPTHAAPPAIVTPVHGIGQSLDAVDVTFLPSTIFLADDLHTPGKQLLGQEYCNIQYVAVNPGANNTLITAKYSMDNSNWVTGPVVVAANAGADNEVLQLPVLARYMAFAVDITANATPVTLSIKGVCK